MGGVEDQLQVAALGDLAQGLDVARPAPDMHADDARGARRDHGLHLGRVEVVRGRIDIAEDRRDLLPLQGVGGGDEGKRGDDHFAVQSQSADGDLQRHGGVAHGDAVLDAQEIGDALLEFLHERAVVGQPAAVEQVVDAGQQRRCGRRRWAGRRGVAQRKPAAAKDRQIFHMTPVAH